MVKVLRKAKSIEPTFQNEKGKIIVIKKKTKESIRREKVISLLGANGSKMSKAKILRKAGYSAAIARQPQKVFDHPEVKDAVMDVLEEMKSHREEVLKQMKLKINKANYTSLSMTLKSLNSDIELLSGRPTSREEYQLPEEEAARLDKLLGLDENEKSSA